MPRNIQDDGPVMVELGIAQLDRITSGAVTPAQQENESGRQSQLRQNTSNGMLAEGPNERLGPFF